MWFVVSAAHRTLDDRRLYFRTTEVELRLAEQLAFLPTLEEWLPASRSEAEVLTTLLADYVDARTEATKPAAAADVVAYIRGMASDRSRPVDRPAPTRHVPLHRRGTRGSHV
ncbi:MAG: hypothetical protein JWQ74_3207 [Marmoricola sp.]|nr:hypothetical protein [Marmoricola sp.]